jgi:hypothetical protein
MKPIWKNISLTILALVTAFAVTARANGPRDLITTSVRSNGNGAVNLQADQAPPGSLWYNGDFDGVNGLANEQNTVVFDARTYDDFIVSDSGGWDVTAVFSDNLADTGITGANYEIRQGVVEGSGGTLLFSGTTAAPNVTATGRSGFGYIEYQVEIDGLSIHLDPGTYWLNVTPIGDSNGRSFVSTTSGADAVGQPPGDDGLAYFDSDYFGFHWILSTDPLLANGHDFSMGVIGTAGGGITLGAHVRRQGGNRFVVLDWSPADGGQVNVLRNGSVRGTTADDGSFQVNIHQHTGTDTYQVCTTDTGACSNTVTVTTR